MESSFRLAASSIIARKNGCNDLFKEFREKKKSAAKEKRTQETQGSECIIFSNKISFARLFDEANGIKDLNVT
jgi:hypothetical protein